MHIFIHSSETSIKSDHLGSMSEASCVLKCILTCHLHKSYLRILHDASYIWLDSVCDAEVNQFQRGIDYDKICWLQVTVDNSYIEDTKDIYTVVRNEDQFSVPVNNRVNERTIVRAI